MIGLTDAHTHPFPTDKAENGFCITGRRVVCAARLADFASIDALPAADVRFYGVHPFFAEETDVDTVLTALRSALAAHPEAGVGEIGLDGLRTKHPTAVQYPLFRAQLEIAATFGRPVTLHGAKCWGEVVAACRPYHGKIPAFLFHGFSRSAGLLPEIFAMNGFVSVGASILNDHAANYRKLVASLPPDRVLVETDGKPEADLVAIAAKTGLSAEQLERNLLSFLCGKRANL